jgi:hypothetical protein
MLLEELLPIMVAAWSKAWNVFARSDTGIVGSNPSWGIIFNIYNIILL